jgi:hypothetical protein
MQNISQRRRTRSGNRWPMMATTQRDRAGQSRQSAAQGGAKRPWTLVGTSVPSFAKALRIDAGLPRH